MEIKKRTRHVDVKSLGKNRWYNRCNPWIVSRIQGISRISHIPHPCWRFKVHQREKVKITLWRHFWIRRTAGEVVNGPMMVVKQLFCFFLPLLLDISEWSDIGTIRIYIYIYIWYMYMYIFVCMYIIYICICIPKQRDNRKPWEPLNTTIPSHYTEYWLVETCWNAFPILCVLIIPCNNQVV